ncbi:MAG TPA: flagellar motor protein MotB [Kofleriaceae bacterium]|nr:flagellar motor protein MotB [Kofleriaceae bacterium]
MARKIKKVEAGHGHHGGAWKVAYADFVTAMMALFMVMWLLASSDQQTRQEISNYFRTGILPDGDMAMNRAAQLTPSVIQASPTPAPAGQEALDEKAEAAKQLVGRLDRLAAVDPTLAQVMRNVHVSINEDGVLIEAVDEARGLLFDLASAQLNEPLERLLRALGPALAALDRPIEINGHTDARPFVAGARLSNWDLSYQRAEAAREILEASGVAPRQIRGVFARGASQLYIDSDPLAPQNRRLSILVKIAKPADTKLARTEHVTPN